MSALKNRPLVLTAVITALLAVVVLPLSHLGADHDENCPLCNPLGHSVIATTAATVVVDADSETFICLHLDRPPVRAAHLLRIAGRAPPASFTS